MAGSKKKSGEVSGFDLVRAVGHTRAQQAPSASSKPPEEEPHKTETTKGGARVRKTALPTKHEILCYECGYRFFSAGRAGTLYCPKCRTILESTDYRFDADCREPVKTTGTVTISENGVVEGALVIGSRVYLDGTLGEGARIQGYVQVEIGPHARFDFKQVETPKLIIGEGTSIRKKRMQHDHIEVAGELTGEIHVTGLLTIRATGCVRGSVTTPRMTMEEGGGLVADICLGVEDTPAEMAS